MNHEFFFPMDGTTQVPPPQYRVERKLFSILTTFTGTPNRGFTVLVVAVNRFVQIVFKCLAHSLIYLFHRFEISSMFQAFWARNCSKCLHSMQWECHSWGWKVLHPPPQHSEDKHQIWIFLAHSVVYGLKIMCVGGKCEGRKKLKLGGGSGNLGHGCTFVPHLRKYKCLLKLTLETLTLRFADCKESVTSYYGRFCGDPQNSGSGYQGSWT